MSTVGGPRLSTIPTFKNTYSMDFDGVDDYVDTGLNLDFATVPNLSISYWIKTDATLTNFASYFAVAVNVSYSNSGYNYSLGRLYKSSSIGLVVYVQGAGSLNGSTTLDDGQWHHIIQTYSDNGNNTSRVRIYVDGNTTPEVDLASTLSYAPLTSNLFIGARNASADRGFPGSVDEVSIYNSTLSTEDITAIYNSGTPTDLTDISPIAWYRMGDNGSWKSPQFLLPNNENKDKVSNYSFEFDGNNDKIELGNPTYLQITGAFSFSCWVNTTSTDYEGIYFKGNSVALNDIYIRRQNNGTVRMFVNGSSFNVTSSTTVNDGNWHHIMCVFVPSTSMTIYIDGSQDAQNTTSIPSTINNNYGNITIGEGGAQYFNGKIDEVSIFNTDQSANISTLYNSGTPTTLPSGAVAHYRMGEEANFTSNWLVDNSALTNYSKRSFEFDGLGDYIDCGTSTLSGETALSISAWVYPTSYGGAAAESFVSTDSTLPRGFYIGVYNASNFRFAFTTNGSNLTAINTTPGTVDLNVWQHILVTWDQINLKFYKNGVLLNTVPTTFASNGTFTTTNNLLIGVRQLGGVGLFEGKIDEVAIFNEVVDIGDVWNGSGEPIDVSAVNGIVSNWRMGEDASFNGTNWTVPDQVGTNNGTSNSLMVDALVGEAPNYTGGGISEGMDIEDRVGNAPNSDNNSLSINMEREDRVEDTP